MKNLFSALTECKSTLRAVNVSDNLGMNGAIEEFNLMMTAC